MFTEVRRTLAIILSLILCLSTIPTAGFATDDADGLDDVSALDEPVALDETDNADDSWEDVDDEAYDDLDEQDAEDASFDESGDSDDELDEAEQAEDEDEQAESQPALVLWTHHVGEEEPGQERTWVVYDAETEENVEASGDFDAEAEDEVEEESEGESDAEDEGDNTALDAIALRLEGPHALAGEDEQASAESEQPTTEQLGVEYRVRASNATWSADTDEDKGGWVANGSDATCAEGASALQVRLTGEMAGEYEVWYRVCTLDGTWLAWTHDGEDAGSDVSPLSDVQVTLVGKGEEAPQNEEGAVAYQEDIASEEEQESEEAASDQSPTTDSAQETALALSAQSQQVPREEETLELSAEKDPSITYRAHVQRIGWQDWKTDGTTAGTTGKALRVEALRLRLKDGKGGVSYAAHVQGIGWQDWKADGAMAGTAGKSLRVEALKLRLTGAAAKTHDIWYRAHVQGTGWTSWVKNGAVAGTTGKALRVEALQVQLVRKGGAAPTDDANDTPEKASTPSVLYKAHVQRIGWQDWVKDGQVAGTSGEYLRVEAMYIKLRGVRGGITYRTHVQTYGWQGWRTSGQMTGTTGRAKRLEAIQIKLTGAVAKTYDVYYRVHIQKIGWMGWAKNGARAGSSGFAYRMEALQIKLVRKGASAPVNDGNTTSPYIGDVTTSYRVSLQGLGWQPTVRNGRTAGKSGERVQQLRANVSGVAGMSLRYRVRLQNGKWQAWKTDGENAGVEGKAISAVRFQLLGNFKSTYNVWYRVHVTNRGWMGWAKNSALAGTDWIAGTNTEPHAVDAIQLKVLRNTEPAPGATILTYEFLNQLNGVDISGHNAPFDMSRLEADFVIIKATEGVSTAGEPATRFNPSYKTWANSALEQGKLLGFYHYANGGDAVKEADAFYNAIKDYKGRAIACLDWEGVGNDLFDTGMDVAWCKKFLDRLKIRFGGTPFLYTSKSYTNAYDWSSVSRTYPLWGAEYASNDPVYGYQSMPWTSSYTWGVWGRKPTIFQYSGNGWLTQGGKPEGYANQPLDLDLFYGTRDAWATYFK